jgi:beta-glucosidase-like glycosyl hydrolase
VPACLPYFSEQNMFCTSRGYGPNINVMRSPQFGRNSEMVGEDPLLSGTYAREMVAEQQKLDAHGHPRMM